MKGERDEFGIPYNADLPDVEPCGFCARWVVVGCECVCKAQVTTEGAA